MSDRIGNIDRRSLLKLLGSAGATAAAVSCAKQLPQVPAAKARVTSAEADTSSGLTGGQWDKSIPLATKGPGGNLNWRPGGALEFAPPEKIPATGKASETFARLPKEQLLKVYERMSLSRTWETSMKELFVRGKDNLYGEFHTYIGEEAIANGVMASLRDDDYIASTHRGHGHLIAKGGDLNKMSAEIFYKETGYNKGYGGSMHLTDVSKGIMGMNGIVGASFYLASGAALRAVNLGTGQVSVAFFGDGAANSPYYFSAVRSCANYSLPVIFVNENNFQMMGVAMATVTPTKYISEYTKGLGIPHHLVDGNDVTAVYAAAAEAVESARRGNGPSVIEGVTYRWYDHSGFAGAKAGIQGAFGLPYRSDKELREWMSRDPIVRYKTWLLDKKLVSADELTRIDQAAKTAVDESITFARSSKSPDPHAGVLNTYAGGPVASTQFYNRSKLTRPGTI